MTMRLGVRSMLAGLAVLLLAVAAASAIYVYRAFPKLDGELHVNGLKSAVYTFIPYLT